MNKKEKDNIVGVMAAVAFAGFCLGAFLANHCYHFRGVTKMIADTVVVRDTVRGVMPTEKDEKVVGTVALPLVPSPHREGRDYNKPYLGGGTTDETAANGENEGKIGSNDTVWATVPRTQKRYEDSTYTAWVSGYEPRLDSIEVYQKTVTITKRVEGRVKNRRFNVGLTGGFGYGVFTRKPDVWVGVGCTWRIF